MKTSHIAVFSTPVDNWNSNLNNTKNDNSVALFLGFFKKIVHVPGNIYECPNSKNVKVRVAKSSKCEDEKTLTYSSKKESFSLESCNLELHKF